MKREGPLPPPVFAVRNVRVLVWNYAPQDQLIEL
jgi:hypothetical protein